MMKEASTIIEASAGTGKTYTLCRIVLQLVLEKRIPIDRILAVTFTEAATNELATRIRELFRSCIDELENGPVKEEVLIEMLAKQSIESEDAIARLRFNLEIFDEAPISTIHGFCKRCLDLIALETEVSFDATLEQIDEELVDRLKNEYIRLEIVEKSAILSAAFASKGNTCGEMLTAVSRECANHPSAILEPKGFASSINDLDRLYQQIHKSIHGLVTQKDLIEPHLHRGRTLFKGVLNDSGIETLKSLACRDSPTIEDFKLIEKLTPKNWKGGIKKTGAHLEMPALFKDGEAFLNSLQNAFQAIVWNYRKWLFDSLREEKEIRNIISFNDLLHMLNHALSSDEDDRIAALLGERFDAALIDEFQDTDPIQYNIINRIFGDGSKHLYFIGDPKQAIYGFRGADIFAYFKATDSDAFARRELLDNYRTSPTLVNSVNFLFQSAPDGFAFEQIQFTPVGAAHKEDKSVPLRIEGLEFSEGADTTKDGVKSALASAAAFDLAKRIRGDSNFDPESVAYLVNNRFEADELSKALSEQGIDSVIKAERSVFDTREALDLLRLLEAASNPSSLRFVRALLLTPILGYDWQDLIDEAGFNAKAAPVIDLIHDWSRNWSKRNFDLVFSQLLSLGNAGERLLHSPDGERAYANYQHLSELLQDEARNNQPTPESLKSWLIQRIQEDGGSRISDHWQTRLRSDAGKPQIVTIHKSKGLEYPIVICPFMSLLRPEPRHKHARYHSDDSGHSLIVDLSPEEGGIALLASQKEMLAETLRLIYVALTRAAHECHVYLVPEELLAKGNKTKGILKIASGFCQLVLGSEKSTAQLNAGKDSTTELFDTLSAWDQTVIEFKTREAALEFDFVEQASRSDETIERVDPRQCDDLAIPYAERILSFSALSQMAHAKKPESDLEEDADDEFHGSSAQEPLPPMPDQEPIDPRPSIFNLRKGADTGNLIHDIFETHDYSRPKTLLASTEAAFESQRFGKSEYIPVVRDHIRRILDKQLESPFGPLTLSKTQAYQRIPEMEFAYPTCDGLFEKIVSAFEAHAPDHMRGAWIDKLKSTHTRLRASMLRGFIDLMIEHEGKVYIFDWKTNHLGDISQDYSTSAINESMADHDYYLQYCLYCVALKRHLASRIGTDDYYTYFGGVYYIYIRGIEPKSDNGVYYDLPSKQLIDELDDAIG